MGSCWSSLNNSFIIRRTRAYAYLTQNASEWRACSCSQFFTSKFLQHFGTISPTILEPFRNVVQCVVANAAYLSTSWDLRKGNCAYGIFSDWQRERKTHFTARQPISARHFSYRPDDWLSHIIIIIITIIIIKNKQRNNCLALCLTKRLTSGLPVATSTTEKSHCKTGIFARNSCEFLGRTLFRYYNQNEWSRCLLNSVISLFGNLFLWRMAK